MTVSIHDLRYGPSPVWDTPTSLPPAPAADLALEQLVREPHPPAEGYIADGTVTSEEMSPDAVVFGAPAEQPAPAGRKGPPTVVFEVVRPNIAAGLDPYLAGLPAYSEDPDSA
jgi:hypothetical protein